MTGFTNMPYYCYVSKSHLLANMRHMFVNIETTFEHLYRKISKHYFIRADREASACFMWIGTGITQML